MLLQPNNRAGRRRGTVTVWVVLSLGALVAVMALTMDGGRMMDERRHAQAAADAAALAAAADLYNNYQTYQGADSTGTAQKAALATASANGYANDGTSSVVTVNIPPQSGAFKGQAGYAEVLVQSNIPAGFGAALMGGSLPVKARAVALGRPHHIGVLTLQSTGPNALTFSGNASLAVAKGSVVVNSTDPLALVTSGNALISARAIKLSGPGSPGVAVSPLTVIQTGVPPTADPLQPLPAPDPSQYPVQSTSALSLGDVAVATLQPGVYQGGISISGNAIVTLLPGIYIMAGGGFNVSGNGSVTGNGVVLYNTTGPDGSASSVSFTGNAAINLTPPTSGPYAGIGVFQDRAVSSPVTISGNGVLLVPGVVYAPAASVLLSGNAGADSTQGGGVIAASLTASGDAAINVDPQNYYTKVPDVRLVE